METSTHSGTSAPQQPPSVDPKLSRFSCKICLEIAEQPVITPCGHLYCWQCIYKWASVKPSCPFCNNKIDVNKLTTIYAEEGEETSSSASKKREERGSEQQQAGASGEQQQQQQSSQNPSEEIPRRPQNPHENFEGNGQQRGQQQQNGGFFFGLPGMMFGGFGGLGGFTFNLNGFQFGGGGGGANNVTGWKRYLGLIPFALFLLQFFYPLLASIFGINGNSSTYNYYSNETPRRSQSSYSSSRRSSSSSQSQSSYSNSYSSSRSRRNQQSSRNQYSSATSFEPEYQEWDWFEYGELIAVFVLMILIYVIGKLRTR